MLASSPPGRRSVVALQDALVDAGRGAGGASPRQPVGGDARAAAQRRTALRFKEGEDLLALLTQLALLRSTYV